MSILPTEFASLEAWSAWALPTETERNARRVSLPFEDISAYAQAILPQVEAICTYIDSHQAEDGSFDDQTLALYQMLLSLAEVAPAIESYDPDVEVTDGYETKLFAPLEDHKLRPAI